MSEELKDLVLLHGFGYGPEVFSPLISKLPRTWKIHVPEWTKIVDGEGLKSLLEVLPPRFDVCGWSLGGQLAVRVACLAPERVRRLALLASNMRYTSNDGWPCAMPLTVFESFVKFLEHDPVEGMRRFASLAGLGCSRRIRFPLEIQLEPTMLLRQISWLRDWDTLGMAATIKQPVCCLHGDRDYLVPAEASMRLANVVPSGRYVEIAASGHAVFLSNPEDVASQLQGFFHDN